MNTSTEITSTTALDITSYSSTPMEILWDLIYHKMHGDYSEVHSTLKIVDNILVTKMGTDPIVKDKVYQTEGGFRLKKETDKNLEDMIAFLENNEEAEGGDVNLSRTKALLYMMQIKIDVYEDVVDEEALEQFIKENGEGLVEGL